jgi:hypothetical protein
MLSLPDHFKFSAIRLSLAAGLTLLILGSLAAQTSENKDIVGVEVQDALSRAETARVVIFLDLPAVPAGKITLLKEEVSRVQDQVLALLDPKDLKVSHRFRSIPSLSGEITAAGLEKLARHPGSSGWTWMSRPMPISPSRSP